jgi:hypothetical protein
MIARAMPMLRSRQVMVTTCDLAESPITVKITMAASDGSGFPTVVKVDCHGAATWKGRYRDGTVLLSGKSARRSEPPVVLPQGRLMADLGALREPQAGRVVRCRRIRICLVKSHYDSNHPDSEARRTQTRRFQESQSRCRSQCHTGWNQVTVAAAVKRRLQ